MHRDFDLVGVASTELTTQALDFTWNIVATPWRLPPKLPPPARPLLQKYDPADRDNGRVRYSERMTGKAIPEGLLVAIEGIDGAGKTTLARRLRAYLDALGVVVTLSKEPTAGPWGMRLRESAATGRLKAGDEVKFLLRDRIQHVEEVIQPALTRGEVVILDRYFPSMIAYQGARGYPVDGLQRLNEFAPTPDVTILVDVSPEVGLARIAARGDTPNSFETLETLQRARRIFLELPMPGITVIDGRQSEDEVFTKAQLAVLTAVADKIRSRKGVTAEAVEELIGFLPSLA